MADIFDAEVVPILRNSPGIRPNGRFEALMKRHPRPPAAVHEFGSATPKPSGIGAWLRNAGHNLSGGPARAPRGGQQGRRRPLLPDAVPVEEHRMHG